MALAVPEDVAALAATVATVEMAVVAMVEMSNLVKIVKRAEFVKRPPVVLPNPSQV